MRRFALLAASLLSACAGTPPADAPTAPPPPPSAEPTASAAAEAPPAPVDDAPSAYFPWAVNGFTLAFHPLKHGGALVSGNGVYRPHVYAVSEAGIQEDPRFLQGIRGVGDPPARWVSFIGGDWPHRASASINTPGDRGGDDTDYEWTGSAWVERTRNRFSGAPREVVDAFYQGGFMGGALWNGTPFWYLQTDDIHFLGNGKAKLPTPAKGAGKCAHQLAGYALLFNDKAGDLVGVGRLCTEDMRNIFSGFEGSGALAVERWKKGSAGSTVTILPGSANPNLLPHAGVDVLEISPTQHYVAASFSDQQGGQDAYVAVWEGGAYRDVSPPRGEPLRRLRVGKDGAVWAERATHLVRRRGEAWETIAPPGEPAKIEREWMGPDGTPWYRFGDTLWHLRADASWEKAVLPKAADGKRYLAQGLAWMGDEMLIVAGVDEGPDTVLLSSKRHDKVVDLSAELPPEAKKPDAKRRAFARVGPPVPGCTTLFVVLYKLSRVAPKDYDFPLTRAALKGHREYADVRFAETEDAGARYFVAFVPDFGKGRSLTKLIADKVQGSKPQMLCGEPPQVNRKIEIDLATGAIRK